MIRGIISARHKMIRRKYIKHPMKSDMSYYQLIRTVLAVMSSNITI